MGKKIQLTIDNPCHENWDRMAPSEKGRFCASCQKHVIDFTGMSDSQLATFFKKPSVGSVCGRFYRDQLDHSIEIPKKRIPWVKYFFQFTLPAFLLSMKATAQGNIRTGKPAVAMPAKNTNAQKITIDTVPQVDLTIEPDVKIQKSESCTLEGFVAIRQVALGNIGPFYSKKEIKNAITGRVEDGNGKRIPKASIRIVEDSSTIYSDAKGLFRLPPWIKYYDTVVLKASGTGYHEKEVVLFRNDRSKKIVIRLEPEAKEIINAEDLTTIKTTPPTQQNPLEAGIEFTVFPNPVQRNNRFQLGFASNKDEMMHVNIVSLMGTLVLGQQEKISKGYNHISVMADAKWSAGIYLIQLRNEKGVLLGQEQLIVK